MMRLPCGKCRWCKVARGREWALRIAHELPYHKHSVFATLTYRTEDLPPRASLSKAVLQNFLKRLRHHYPAGLKYFCCGEYGDPKHVQQDDPNYMGFLLRGFSRPHYHCILFGPSLDDHELTTVDPTSTERGWYSLKGPINDSWGYGFIVLGTVTYHSALYCVSYMQKSFTSDVNQRIYGHCQPPFQIQSKGLGRQYAIDYKTQLTRDLAVSCSGTLVGLPRYYAKLLIQPSAINTVRLHTKAADATLASRFTLETKQGITEGWAQNDELHKQTAQRGKTILKRLDLKGHSKL